MNKEKGFTMIELVMVIVIIGILAAIAIPRFMDLRASARQAACQQSGGALRAAISNFYASQVINVPADLTPWPGTVSAAVLGGYLQSWPAAPTSSSGNWNAHYTAATGVLSVGLDGITGACPKK
ncbi:MAG: prepilin-type N-terminal cleavage/methylation domain-containing protein [Candidatus Omnitrophota bacterium]|nr:prepilin-type N-terminal cleavage/methylation domain-containing protein [Candidatus Omnitrophota bacterium]